MGKLKCTLDNDELRALRAQGLTYRAIAERAGVTPQRVMVRVRKQKRWMPPVEADPAPLPATGAQADPAMPISAYKPLLSVRSWNALIISGNEHGTVADVRTLGARLLLAPNLGIKSYAELCRVFGIEGEPPKSKNKAGVY